MKFGSERKMFVYNKIVVGMALSKGRSSMGKEDKTKVCYPPCRGKVETTRQQIAGRDFDSPVEKEEERVGNHRYSMSLLVSRNKNGQLCSHCCQQNVFRGEHELRLPD